MKGASRPAQVRVTGRGVRRYLDDLLAGRRPRPFRATQADADELRAAIELRAARPGDDDPREGFLDELHQRLAAELAAAPISPPRPSPGLPPSPPRPRRGRGVRGPAGPSAPRLVAQGAAVAAASAAVGAAAATR